MKRYCIILLLYASTMISHSAADVYVNPGESIQSAIDASDPNGTIIVLPGIYVENIYIDKDIVLTSIDPNDPNIVDSTIIDGNQNGRVVEFSEDEFPNRKLTGFTIQNGYASGSYPNNYGGGIYGNGSVVFISHCIIQNNEASGSGGGLSSCDGTIKNCDISGNTARFGGGIYKFEGTISNCIISGNTAEYGGGLYGCNGTIKQGTITGNTVDYDGGGFLRCDGTITECAISGNIAQRNGGGLYGCDGTITNNVIYENTAGQGGGLYDCDGKITNCTIVGNTAENEGGGLIYCNTSITNCIIWNNIALVTGDDLYESSIPSYSCYPDGGNTNINTDPKFVNEAGNDYSLAWDSPCIDKGTNQPSSGLPAIDIEGISRPQDGDNNGFAIADMGAYEKLYMGPVIVLSAFIFDFESYSSESNPNSQMLEISSIFDTFSWEITKSCDWLEVKSASGTLTGEPNEVTISVNVTDIAGGDYSCELTISAEGAINSPQTVQVNLHVGSFYVPKDFSTIQVAIDATVDEDIIIIAEGTYYENINIDGKNITLTSTDPDNEAVVANTIVDGNDIGRVITFAGTETSACQLTGLTITGGYSTEKGGGIQGNDTYAGISKCTIIGNNSESIGGAIQKFNGDISECKIIGNSAYNGGAFAGCQGQISYCIIVDNTATSGCGGINNCDGDIVNCIIAENTGVDSGGIRNCDGTFTNCIIWGNSEPEILNCTAVAKYNCFAGGTDTNIDADPLFSNDGDYRLMSEAGRWNPNTESWEYDVVTSPCIDAGDPDDTGWKNELWPHGGRINMGIYGGTLVASMSLSTTGSIADFNHDDTVDGIDIKLFAEDWLKNGILLYTDMDRDNDVDLEDFALLSENF